MSSGQVHCECGQAFAQTSKNPQIQNQVSRLRKLQSPDDLKVQRSWTPRWKFRRSTKVLSSVSSTQKKWQRNVDTNPSIIAGCKTSGTAVAQRSLDGVKNFAANWVNWRTQADLLEKNVSATIFGYSVKQTSALVRSRQQRQRTPIIRKCAQISTNEECCRGSQRRRSHSESARPAATAMAAAAAAATVAAMASLVDQSSSSWQGWNSS